MSVEQTIRFKLIERFGDTKSLEEIEAMLKYIMGAPSTIIPASFGLPS